MENLDVTQCCRYQPWQGWEDSSTKALRDELVGWFSSSSSSSFCWSLLVVYHSFPKATLSSFSTKAARNSQELIRKRDINCLVDVGSMWPTSDQRPSSSLPWINNEKRVAGENNGEKKCMCILVRLLDLLKRVYIYLLSYDMIYLHNRVVWVWVSFVRFGACAIVAAHKFPEVQREQHGTAVEWRFWMGTFLRIR